MSGGRGPTEDVYDGVWPLMEQATGLDVFLEQLSGDRRPAPQCLTPRDVAVRMAAQLRLVCEGVEERVPEFLQALDREVGRALAQEQRRLSVSRGRFLRRVTQVAAATGLVGAGAAADELVSS